MLALLVAYIQGRGGVLDDRGQVIDTEPCEEPVDGYGQEYHGDIEESGSVEIHENVKRRPWWRRFPKVFAWLVSLLWIVWAAFLSWRFGGWIGHSLLGISGVLGNIAGLVGCLGAIALMVILGNRLTSARRDLRSRKGMRSLEDHCAIFGLVNGYQCCGACVFSIRGFDPESDGCVVCPECGAAWDPSLWEGFLMDDRNGIYEGMKKKHRRVFCILDGRGQMTRVLSHLTINELNERVHQCKARLALWDGFLIGLIALILLSAIVGAVLILINITQNGPGAIALTVAIVVLVAVLVMAINAGKRSIRQRKLQLLTRDLIDDRACPECEGSLGEAPHPIDGALVCNDCGLAWHAETSKQSHHTRKRIPDERFKEDEVFQWQSD